MKEEDFAFNIEAFHVLDIRGVYPSQINEAIAYHVGGAFVSVNKLKEVVVGRDVRLSSQSLSRAIIAGMNDAGANVTYIGVVDTPRVYYASGKMKMAGVMITASHDPAEYNGIKFVLSGAVPFAGESLKKLAQTVWKPSQTRGKIIDKDLTSEYLSYILSYIDVKKIKPMKIVIDAGNGVSGEFAERLFGTMNHTIIPLFFEPDGSFPNHVPNPAIPSNLLDLRRAVVEHKADLGIEFDGDADRVFFVDKSGNTIIPSVTALIIAKHILSKKKGAIVHTALSSRIVAEGIKEAGGTPLAEKIGHSFIKARMRNEKALFGAEESGHYYYKENYYADSAFITAVLFCEMLSQTGEELFDMKKLMKYYKPDEISIRSKNRDEVVQELMFYCQKQKPLKKKIFDGTTFVYKDHWINVRSSNTEPLVRVVMEADNEKVGKLVESKLKDFIKSKRFE